MPICPKSPYFLPKDPPDNTPVRAYEVHLSDKQVESLKSLKRRNFAGFSLGVVNEVKAIARMVDDVCSSSAQKANEKTSNKI
tara:strand:- start:42 stop:287 length:246 start_codon:yes stop_codon:yes gene_type:complete